MNTKVWYLPYFERDLPYTQMIKTYSNANTHRLRMVHTMNDTKEPQGC